MATDHAELTFRLMSNLIVWFIIDQIFLSDSARVLNVFANDLTNIYIYIYMIITGQTSIIKLLMNIGRLLMVSSLGYNQSRNAYRI